MVIAEFVTDSETDIDNGECPVCRQNPAFGAGIKAAILEGDAIFNGEMPAKWYRSVGEAREDLDI